MHVLLFTGQIRNPQNFAGILEAALAARATQDFNIVFSTWDNELDPQSPIGELLRKLDALVLTQPQPNLILPGHILHQISSLELALSFIQPDDYILKLRPDLSRNTDIGLLFQTMPVPVPSDSVWPLTFGHKIRIAADTLACPFYINDIIYSGVARDIAQICALPFMSILRYTRPAPEQLYWGGALFPRVPVLDTYFRVNVGLIFDNVTANQACHAALLKSPLFARALACGWLVAADNFVQLRDDTPHEADHIRARAAQYTLEELLWSPVDVPGISHRESAVSNFCNSQEVRRMLLDGDFKTSAFGDKVIHYVAHYRSVGVAGMHREKEELAREAAEIGAALESCTQAGRLRFFESQAMGYNIRNRDPEWIFGQTGGSLTQKLEGEVNMLRRSNEQLRNELRIVKGF